MLTLGVQKSRGLCPSKCIPRSILEKILSEPALGYVEMRDTHMLVFNSVATVSVAVGKVPMGVTARASKL